MIKTIVIAYDDSEASQRALERAATLAKAFESKLIVATVAPVTTPAAARSIGADPTESAQEHRAELTAARSYLEGAGLQADYVEAVGHPAESILAVAAERSADLIVTGARELGHVQRLLGQSVSDAVSHGAHCDVLIVH
jgi:nucleotide-binding universal stress UspA family protein